MKVSRFSVLTSGGIPPAQPRISREWSAVSASSFRICGGNIGGSSQREDVARRDTVKQRQPVAAHFLQLIDRVLDTGVEELDADVGVVPDRRGARGVVVEEFHRYVGGDTDL